MTTARGASTSFGLHRRAVCLPALLVVVLAALPACAQFTSGDIRAVATPDATWMYNRFTGRCVAPNGEVYARTEYFSNVINVYASVSAWQGGSPPVRTISVTGITDYAQFTWANNSIYASNTNGGGLLNRWNPMTGAALTTTITGGSTTMGWGGPIKSIVACDGVYLYVNKDNIVQVRDMVTEALLRTATLPYDIGSLTTGFAAGRHYYPVRYTSPSCLLEHRVNGDTAAVTAWGGPLSAGCDYLTEATFDYFFNRLIHTNGNPGSCQDTTFLYNNVLPPGPQIRTVDATLALVAPGQLGVDVSFSVENIGVNPFTINAVDLGFRDAMSTDRSSEYVVTPDAGNPTVIASGATENFAFTVDVLPAATLGTITVDGILDAVDQVTMLPLQDNGADTPDAWDVIGAAPQVRVVTATPAEVPLASSGHQVSFSAENVGLNPLTVTSVTLGFYDAALVDQSAHYVVTPAPTNPTSLAIGASGNFDFTVQVLPTAPLGTMTIHGEIETVDQVSMAMVIDIDADTPDTWDVRSAEVFVREVNALPAMVSAGGSGYQVAVDVENTGLNSAVVAALVLTFFGTADRTPEYTVTPVPGNPTFIGPGATVTFDLRVAVALSATAETITLDAAFVGLDPVTGSFLADADADITDLWDVVPCAVPFCGDCNGDTVTSILDALIAAQHSAGVITLVGPAFSSCNVQGALEPLPAAAVDILDALSIAQAAAGLPAALTCC